MMGWIILFLLVLICAAALIKLGKLSRATYEITAAALLIGVAGYAWQGHPGMAVSMKIRLIRATRWANGSVQRASG